MVSEIREDLARQAEKHVAATKLQAQQRGSAVRAEMAEKHAAATKLQAQQRGSAVRAGMAEKHAAATKLQAQQRGSAARAEMAEKHAAATKLQAQQRGSAVRAQMGQTESSAQHNVNLKSVTNTLAEKHMEVKITLMPQIQQLQDFMMYLYELLKNPCSIPADLLSKIWEHLNLLSGMKDYLNQFEQEMPKIHKAVPSLRDAIPRSPDKLLAFLQQRIFSFLGNERSKDDNLAPVKEQLESLKRSDADPISENGGLQEEDVIDTSWDTDSDDGLAQEEQRHQESLQSLQKDIQCIENEEFAITLGQAQSQQIATKVQAQYMRSTARLEMARRNAATKLHAQKRGLNTRLKLKHEAAIQRQDQSKHSSAGSKMDQKHEDAARLQVQYRRSTARVEMARNQQKQTNARFTMAPQKAAATKLQALQRGASVRLNLARWQEAAIKLQSICRGSRARLHLAQMHAAATKVQTQFRKSKARTDMGNKAEQDDSMTESEWRQMDCLAPVEGVKHLQQIRKPLGKEAVKVTRARSKTPQKKQPTDKISAVLLLDWEREKAKRKELALQRLEEREKRRQQQREKSPILRARGDSTGAPRPAASRASRSSSPLRRSQSQPSSRQHAGTSTCENQIPPKGARSRSQLKAKIRGLRTVTEQINEDNSVDVDSDASCKQLLVANCSELYNIFVCYMDRPKKGIPKSKAWLFCVHFDLIQLITKSKFEKIFKDLVDCINGDLKRNEYNPYLQETPLTFISFLKLLVFFSIDVMKEIPQIDTQAKGLNEILKIMDSSGGKRKMGGRNSYSSGKMLYLNSPKLPDQETAKNFSFKQWRRKGLPARDNFPAPPALRLPKFPGRSQSVPSEAKRLPSIPSESIRPTPLPPRKRDHTLEDMNAKVSEFTEYLDSVELPGSAAPKSPRLAKDSLQQLQANLDVLHNELSQEKAHTKALNLKIEELLEVAEEKHQVSKKILMLVTVKLGEYLVVSHS